MRARPADIEFICNVLHEASGMVLADKGYLVRSLLTPLAYEVGNGDLAAVVELLRADPGGALEQRVVELLLNNETWFFRDSHVFAALTSDAFPELEQSGRRPIRIWSAGCSSGQEPYSIAMMVDTFFPRLAHQIEIHATDLSESMLDRAREGLYTQLEVNRGLPVSMLVKYFEDTGAQWRVKKTLRERVRFRRSNLVRETPDISDIDIVFLRNVLLYFDAETRKSVLDGVHRILRPDGYLVLGAAEATFPLKEAYAVQSKGRAAFYRACALEV